MDFGEFDPASDWKIRDIDKAQKIVDTLNELRVNQILRECGALVEEMQAQGCGLYLETVGGWFHSVRVHPDVAPNTISWEDRKV